MAVDTQTENKVVHNNDHATVVIVNGEIKVIKVKRLDGRDIEFKYLTDLEDFLQGAKEVLDAAKFTLFGDTIQTKRKR
jgi:hypothetical protein